MLQSPRPIAADELPASARLAVCSRGILAIPHLSVFFDGRPCMPMDRGPAEAVVGWGNRRSGLRARREAARRGIPLVLLEDGFMRSVGLGKLGAPPLSLVADDVGMYFDARAPSRLERLLADLSWFTPALRIEAVSGLGRWRAERLSKYNVGADELPGATPSRVLLIDQVRGDASIAGALACEATFARMLAEALATHGAARLAVRIHPDVVAGRARGYLAERARAAGVAILDPNLSSHAALDVADAVWTVSSAIGFEAVLRGIHVRTFGVPFYAGFGLTEDVATGAEAALARRGMSRTLVEMFAAAFLVYARYADPVTRRAISFDQAVDRLLDWRHRTNEFAARRTLACGFSWWKRPSAAIFLGAAARPVQFVARAQTRLLPKARRDGVSRIALWGVTEPDGFADQARAHGLAVARVEDGFIRSVGLGSDFRPAGSLVVDDLGIYYDALSPSRLEAILQANDFSQAALERARLLRKHLVASSTTKYNLGAAKLDVSSRAQGRPAILVAEQVPGDASLHFGAGAVSTNLGLLEAARRERPDAFVIYKEHPDVVAGNRRGRLPPATLSRNADLIVSDGDIASLFPEVEEVHVVSSLAGFEALCRGMRVVVWGRPFYAGWGLTNDRTAIPRRTRKLTLDALVAGTLIAYPRYIDPLSQVPCSVEEFLDTLDVLRARGPEPRQPYAARQLRRLGRWLASLPWHG